VSLLYNNGIGTDATIHEHIKKIKDREYVEKSGPRGLKSTKLGKALIKWYRNLGPAAESLIGANVRGELEYEL
jgi:DNA topoisomerase III